MRVLGRRPDGALHLTLSGGLSIILRGGFASPPSESSVVARLGPWHRATSFDPNMQRKVELRLDRARTVPLVALSALPNLGVADDGMWSCPHCGQENTVALAAGCERRSCPSRHDLAARLLADQPLSPADVLALAKEFGVALDAEEAFLLEGTSEGAAKGWETRKGGGGADEQKKGLFGRIKGKVKDKIGKAKAAYAKFEEDRKSGALESAAGEARRNPFNEGANIARSALASRSDKARETLIAQDRAKHEQYAKAFKIGQ
jgi:hypothetical protein